MRTHILLLLTCFQAGCNAVSPLPGHLTRDVSQEQMTSILDKHLKPGMPIEEAQAFLKKEDYMYVTAQEPKPGTQSIRFVRRDQLDFWVHQDWAVILESNQGRLQRYTVTSSLTGP